MILIHIAHKTDHLCLIRYIQTDMMIVWMLYIADSTTTSITTAIRN